MHLRTAVVLLAALILLPGCLEAVRHDPLPTTAQRESLGAAPHTGPSWAAPVVLQPGGFTIFQGNEPNVREDADGRVYVGSTLAYFWRSLDGGATFRDMDHTTCLFLSVKPPVTGCPPGAKLDIGPLDGGGDGSIATPGNGTVYWLGLAGTSGQVPFQRSTDAGGNWTAPVDLAGGNSADRQWLALSPNGTIFAVWRESSPDLLDVMRVSHDGGNTWGPRRVLFTGAFPVMGVPQWHGGALYVPYDDGQIGVAVTSDEGATWTFHHVPSRIVRDDLGLTRSIFPQMAIDGAGTLYVAWSDADNGLPGGVSVVEKSAQIPTVHLSASTDGGATWSTRVVSTPGQPGVMPAIVAGSAGHVALAWYQAATPLPAEQTPSLWDVDYAQSDDSGGNWTVSVADPLVHVGAICTSGLPCTAGDRTRGDFFDMDLQPNGLPILAFCTDPKDPTQDAQVNDIVVLRATSGTPLR